MISSCVSPEGTSAEAVCQIQCIKDLDCGNDKVCKNSECVVVSTGKTVDELRIKADELLKARKFCLDQNGVWENGGCVKSKDEKKSLEGGICYQDFLITCEDESKTSVVFSECVDGFYGPEEDNCPQSGGHTTLPGTKSVTTGKTKLQFFWEQNVAYVLGGIIVLLMIAVLIFLIKKNRGVSS